MTDLPFGRGGSPLQNLISRGIHETKISAIKVVKELDAGPVYLKRDLSLYGTAEEIYLRAGDIIIRMIEEIMINNPIPQEQIGEPTTFKRRKPEMSKIENLKSIEQLFDFIRMLDAEGYPKAFLENENFRFEFSRASLKSDNTIITDVRISKK
jgi:methionyl-tRNA formyltransferase